MSTIIRAKISTSNPYYISKHRYYELKHHCLQYPEWKQEIAKLRTRSLIQAHSIKISTDARVIDKTAEMGLVGAYMASLVTTVDKCCEIAGGDISDYIHIAVTQGKSYSVLNPPCGKEYFYKKYRQFFWLLDKELS